jgi:hypothetical protein
MRSSGATTIASTKKAMKNAGRTPMMVHLRRLFDVRVPGDKAIV